MEFAYFPPITGSSGGISSINGALGPNILILGGSGISVGTVGNNITITNTNPLATDSFVIMQTPLGTSPTASSPTDTLTWLNTDGTITITGNSLAKSITLNTSGLQPSGNYITALTGDITASGPGSAAATLATVNASPGTYTNATVTVNAKGLVTSASSGSVGTVTAVTASSPLSSSGGATPNISLTGIVPIANGGTGQSTASAAFAALSPLTTAGDLIYENATPAPTRLPIGTTGQVLTVVGGLPAWSTASVSANTFLSNLTSPTAVNQSLLFGTDATYNIGAASEVGRPLYIYVASSVFIGGDPIMSGLPLIELVSGTGVGGLNNVIFYSGSSSGNKNGILDDGSNFWIQDATNLTRYFALNTNGGGTVGGAFSFSYSTSQLKMLQGDANGNIAIGNAALATSATNGFFYLNSTAGVPTGVPAASFTGAVPLNYDTTDNRLYAYNSGWKNVVSAVSGNSFLTSGTTYTTPANITTSSQFKFTLIGGGGGGGGSNTGGQTSSGGGAAGGLVVYLTGLSPSTAYTIAIGAAGAGGASTPTAGGTGGNTTLTVGATTYTASGGTGGGTTSATPGAGGTATNGTINITGQLGAAIGIGGCSPFGFGLGGPAPILTPTAGNPATGYGGGGSGARGASFAGGTGTQGCILVEWSL